MTNQSVTKNLDMIIMSLSCRSSTLTSMEPYEILLHIQHGPKHMQKTLHLQDIEAIPDYHVDCIKLAK